METYFQIFELQGPAITAEHEGRYYISVENGRMPQDIPVMQYLGEFKSDSPHNAIRVAQQSKFHI